MQRDEENIEYTDLCKVGWRNKFQVLQTEWKGKVTRTYTSGSGAQANSPNTTKVLWGLHLSTVQSSRSGNSSPNLSLSATQTGILRRAVFPILDTRTSQCWAKMKWRCSADVNNSLTPWRRKTLAEHTSLSQAPLPSYPLILRGQITRGKKACEHQEGSGISSFCLQASVQHVFQSWSSLPMSSGSVAHGSQFQASLGVLQAEGALQHLDSRHFLTGFVLSYEMCNNPWPESVTVLFSKCLKVTSKACVSHISLV